MNETPDAPDADRRDAPIDLTGRRIRVGYVSSDLREHAIGYLMAELFEIHDKTKFEVFGYYCGKDPQGGPEPPVSRASPGALARHQRDG